MSPLPTGLGLRYRQGWNKPELLTAFLNSKSTQLSHRRNFSGMVALLQLLMCCLSGVLFEMMWDFLAQIEVINLMS